MLPKSMACWRVMPSPHSIPPTRSRPAIWRLVLALASLAGLGWWWQAVQPVEMPSPTQRPVAAVVAPDVLVPPVTAPGRQPPTRPAPDVPQTDGADCAASLAPQVRLRAAAAAASAAGRDGALQPLLARIESEERRALEAGAALHAAAVERLRASAEPTTRAVGLQLAAMPQSTGRADCRGDDCDAALLAAWQQAKPPLAELAMLALRSQDGEIYARAWAACQRADRLAADVPACSQLSAQRWAQLAPDAAAPWLDLAAQARAAGDVGGELHALQRAALAARWHRPAGGLLRELLAQAGPSTSDPIARWHGDWHALSAELQVPDDTMRTLLNACAAPLDANRQQVCSQLFGRALAASEDLLQLTMAIHLGQRVGWPAEQLVVLQQERDALRVAAASHAMQWIPPEGVATWSPTALCAGLAAMRQHLARRAEVGELAALRALLPAPVAAASAQAR